MKRVRRGRLRIFGLTCDKDPSSYRPAVPADFNIAGWRVGG
jgi:hypothetical protein